jgi:hypothetical protein
MSRDINKVNDAPAFSFAFSCVIYLIGLVLELTHYKRVYREVNQIFESFWEKTEFHLILLIVYEDIKP